jgi:hypothetical protein
LGLELAVLLLTVAYLTRLADPLSLHTLPTGQERSEARDPGGVRGSPSQVDESREEDST